MGAESDTDSLDEHDSGDEWDKKEHGDWLHCPSPPLRVGPTCAEAHVVARKQDTREKDPPTWEDIIGKPLPKNTEEEDSDWEKDDRGPAESQFEDAATAAEIDMDTVEESTVEALPEEDIAEASVSLVSQDIFQIHTGNDDLDYIG